MSTFRERLRSHASAVYQELRPAQEHVLDVFEHDFATVPDVGIELPTGVGKTLIALLLADRALDEGMSVAYLTGTRQLAEQVEDQAVELRNLVVHRFYGGHYPGAALDDVNQAQAVGVMNYWVYFNSRPRVQPADVIIFDDAHLAEQSLTGLAGVRISAAADPVLYVGVCDLLMAHTSAYSSLKAMRDGTAPFNTPPELIAFNDWAAIATAATDLIENSVFARSDEGRWSWPSVRPYILRCGVLIGAAAIEIRPYHPPTQTNPWYSRSRQRIYLSATLGSMGDLQRRLGVLPVARIDVPANLHSQATGHRLLLLNPTSEASLSTDCVSFALAQAAIAGRVAWLCASHAEADSVEGLLTHGGHATFRLRPGDDGELESWRGSPNGHLIAAGRFDGLDLADEVCRLVVLPSVPAASTEFERFAVAYLGDASFMRHRVGQRVTQALGRANRTAADWALYLGLDPGFASALSQPEVRLSMGTDVSVAVRTALQLHTGNWEPVADAARRFWDGEAVTVDPVPTRPGRTAGQLAAPVDTAGHEVETSTALWLGDMTRAATEARVAADALRAAGEAEHSAFWRYVEAHSLFSDGSPRNVAKAADSIRDAIADAPRTPWFVRLRRTLDELEGRAAVAGDNDYLFLQWDEWIREAGARTDSQISAARRQLAGSHNEKAQALLVLARLCGAVGERPTGEAATDVRWTWVTPRRAERRVWEIKTGTAARAVSRGDVNQLLGQLHVEAQDHPRVHVVGCLMSPLPAVEAGAAIAARDGIAIIQAAGVEVMFDWIADRFRQYAAAWGAGTAIERGRARTDVDPRVPRGGWLASVLSPSGGVSRGAVDVRNILAA